jgi:hypothetical protein
MDMIYDIMGYHLSRMSEAAAFLPENRGSGCRLSGDFFG